MIFGADSYQGIWEPWNEDRKEVYPIQNNKTPFQDSEFKTIVSNMVLEHIHPNQVAEVAKEMSRILSINGIGINIFPTKKTLIEGHIGVPLVHLLKNKTSIKRIYLNSCFLVGLGYWRSDKKRGSQTTVNRKDWVNRSIEVLENETFYNAVGLWKGYFNKSGCKVENISYLLAIHVLPSPLQFILKKLCKINLIKKVLNLLVEMRLGVILKVTKL